MLINAVVLVTCGIVVAFIVWQVYLIFAYRKSVKVIQEEQLMDLQRAESALRENLQRLQTHRLTLQRDLQQVLDETRRFEQILATTRPDASKAVPKVSDDGDLEDGETLDGDQNTPRQGRTPSKPRKK